MAIAAIEINVTAMFVIEENICVLFVPPPAATKNVWNIFHCIANAATTSVITIIVSINLSATTVPKDCTNGTLSHLSSTAQRDTSPTRGTTRFAPYAMNMA